MLINTVVLFLRDALPIFILMALLLNTARESLNHFALFLAGIILGSTLSIILMQLVQVTADFWDGIGTEVLFTILLIGFYIIAVLHILSSDKRPQIMCSVLIVALLTINISLNGASLYTYLYGYWSRGAANVLLLGTFLGTGISICVGIILYYCVHWLKHRISLAAQWILALYMAGQMNKILQYLEQIGWLTSNEPLWDTSALISERSEFGHFLTAFIGYEESPTLLYLGMFIIWASLPMLLKRYFSQRASNIPEQLNRSTSS